MIKSITIDTSGKVTPLCKIAMHFQSDKCPYSQQTTSGHRHPYTPFYDELFSSLRDEEINVAEIGIEKNDSINIWRRYFPLAKIYGYEYSDEYLENARSQNLLDVQYEKFNIQDENSIHSTLQKVGVKYDIIVEDSTHLFEDQIRFIKNSIEYLKPGGILVIEDIFRNRSEDDYKKELAEVEKYFEEITFVTTEHENRYSPGWDNDKLIVLVRNNVSSQKDNQNSKVFIVTPSRRPFNLEFIADTIPQECEWIVVFDKTVKNEHKIENATVLKSNQTGFWGNPNRNIGLEYIKNHLNPSDNDWIYILDDDNVIHPDWWNSIQPHLNSTDAVMTWGQTWATGEPRTEPTDNPRIATIDTSQYIVRWGVAKNLRFEHIYEADGIYAEEAAKQGTVKKLDQYLGYYNFLRAHKSGQEIRTNICMISMFKNESKGIRRMLESVWRHIDFYVFQDNGSTDGTPEIVEEFFRDKNIPGFIYKVEEGWVSFGWNRDHLLQTTLHNDHGCDWIMKMDCDEYLEVDPDFDWSAFYDTSIQSFHVAAMNPGCIYYRAWIWNAKLPWKFKHDVAHECIYLDDGVNGENFQIVDLPRSLRMCGTNDGESYTVRTKYISDALKLEEKLIREETMLTDRYHFWYTGKSYMDCFRGDFYPLGEHHSREFARRAIFYFTQYLDVVHERGNLQRGINEMCYYATFCVGECYKFLGEIDKAIYYFKDAESFCPVRNEHLVHLAHTYNELGQYDKMLEVTTRLVDPERKLPFPDYYFLIDTNLYYDSGPVPQHLHNHALARVNETGGQKTINSFTVHAQPKPRLWIVDNFYDDPYAVREFALNQEFEENLDYYKGNRTKNQYIIPGTKEAFEKIIGKKITNWTETHGMCGRFQYCTAQDDLVYHCDGQTLAGMVYLTPDAPFSCGTSLFAHKDTKLRNENDFGDVNVFGQTGFYDRTKFELVDTAGNVFNRLVLFDAKCIHSANEYFGTDKNNSRLFHLFFFD
jgi:glycosyltransferase involved in cell wall biosynthesis